MLRRRRAIRTAYCLAVGLGLTAILLPASAPAKQVPFNPALLTKYIDDLVIPPAMPNDGTPNSYRIGGFWHRQVLTNQPPFNTPDATGVGTWVFSYGAMGQPQTQNWPGFTIEATRHQPVTVQWVNKFGKRAYPLPVDTTIMWANPFNQPMGAPYTGPAPMVTHVHGAEVRSDSDGHPLDWFMPGQSKTDTYPNDQPGTTLWYHDHTMGMTRLNVFMGLAGFYLLRDPANEPAGLPGPAPQIGDPPGTHYYEIPIAIQDREFDTKGQFLFQIFPPNPGVHPNWMPEFFGLAMVVNGKLWPKLNVEPRRYRFRLLNGCNARFLRMRLYDADTGAPGPGIWQIGTDGGYLNAPVLLSRPNGPADSPKLILGPAERADIIVDFTGIPPGKRYILGNDAQTPFPMGIVPEPDMDSQIMRFDVVAPDPTSPPDTSLPPRQLVLRAPGNQIPQLTPTGVHPHDIKTRTLVLYEKLSPSGVLAVYVDGKSFADPVSETPTEGTTEVWEFVNLTMDTHPFHLHLTQFQLLGRQKFRFAPYLRDYDALNPVIPAPVTTAQDVAPYLRAGLIGPDANERGWKDTIRMNPFEVTWIAIRFGQLETGARYTFDPSIGPGYVEHCHILDHEDNEMMRPYQVIAVPGPR
jgi:spore coat protein A, manganese oxidase